MLLMIDNRRPNQPEPSCSPAKLAIPYVNRLASFMRNAGCGVGRSAKVTVLLWVPKWNPFVLATFKIEPQYMKPNVLNNENDMN